jgi:8-oxo-dGTP pyrophosphatase MutT (NUDIX family)
MLFVKSVGAVVFRRLPDGRINYLLLQHRGNYWNFPKGRKEEKESDKKTALREIQEETGLTAIKILPKFRQTEKYFFRLAQEVPKIKQLKKTIFKEAIFYLASAPANCRVKISCEHQDFGWFDLSAALKKLKYKSSREILKKADKFL